MEGAGGLLDVDTFAHNRSGIGYQDKGRLPETVPVPGLHCNSRSLGQCPCLLPAQLRHGVWCLHSCPATGMLQIRLLGLPARPPV
jgi:hypothetical protein